MKNFTRESLSIAVMNAGLLGEVDCRNGIEKIPYRSKDLMNYMEGLGLFDGFSKESHEIFTIMVKKWVSGWELENSTIHKD